jgi:hypothetical protein
MSLFLSTWRSGRLAAALLLCGLGPIAPASLAADDSRQDVAALIPALAPVDLDVPLQKVAAETFGGKLRRLAAGAAIANSVKEPPLRPAPLWRPNQAYNPGEVVQNGTGLYMCFSAGTSSSSGGPGGTGYAPIADGSVGWVYFGPPIVTSPDPEAPQLSTTGLESTLQGFGLTRTYNPVATPQSFTFGSGIPTPAPPPMATTQLSFPAVHSKTSMTGGNTGFNNGTEGFHWSASFVTSAPVVAIGTSHSAVAMITIDGRRLFPGGQTGPAGYNPIWYILDFRQAGGRKERNITLEAYGNIRFAGVRVDAGSSVWAAPTTDRIRVAFFGSSIEAGNRYFPTMGNLSWPVQTSKLLGWSDPWNLGLGGTGYIANQNGVSFSYIDHIDDAIRIAPDIVVIGGAINDASIASPAAITAAANSLLQTLRARLPNALLIATGTFPGTSGPSTARINSEVAVKTAVQQLHDPRIFFVPVISAPCGTLIAGTGTIEVPNGTGNADFYISGDRTHPSQQGLDYVAAQFAAGIQSVVISALP